MKYLHSGVSPGLNMVPGLQRHPHHAVGGHAQQFVLLLPVEPGHSAGSGFLSGTRAFLPPPLSSQKKQRKSCNIMVKEKQKRKCG